jgi:hypothetical protein
MKKYFFSQKVDNKVTKHEIVAETLDEAYKELMILGYAKPFLPDYVEPIDAPDDLELKTYNVSYYADGKDAHDGITTTITYKAISSKSVEEQFLEDFPDQREKPREIHMPLGNYAVDRENAKIAENPTNDDNTASSSGSSTPKRDYTAYLTNLFTKSTQYVKLSTILLFGVIGLDLLITAILGKEQSFGVIDNITAILNHSEGLSGVIVLFLVYFLFIRSGKTKKTDKK